MSPALARELRDIGSNGIPLSVRVGTGECVTVFLPRILSNCRQEQHLCYVRDRRAISTVYEKRNLDV